MIRIEAEPAIDADIVVAGGGPAGAASAAHLADAGFRVIVVDQAVFPRDKVCGDFVSPVGLLELEKLGVDAAMEKAHANKIHEAAVFLDGSHVLTRPMPRRPSLPTHGLVVPRERLDEFILDSALARGVELIDETKVAGYRVEESAVAVDVSDSGSRRVLRARLLIGADGSNSTVGRQLRGPVRRRSRIMAVRAYFENVSGPADRSDLLFHTETFPGYTWLFPVAGGTANVGVGMASAAFPKPPDQLRPMLERLVVSDPALHSRLSDARPVGRIKGFPLSTYDPSLRITGERVALVGDAAGLINPINGEGIQYALLSGRWLAEAVVSSGRAHLGVKGLDDYRSRLARELGGDLTLARLIVQTILNRDLNPVSLGVLRVVLERARTDPEYAELAGSILAGLRPVTTALRAKMLSAFAFQAARQLRSAITGQSAEPGAALARAGLDAAQVGFQLAHDTWREPKRVWEWAEEVVKGAGSFSTHLLTDAVTRRRSSI